MGRFLEFSTGFYYKMFFGVQKTTDINYFMGYFTGGSHEVEMFYCRWNIEKINLILEKIKSLNILNFDLENIKNYEKTSEGTLKLYQDILKIINHNDENMVKFILGCIIYHQLLYDENLSATLYL